MITTPIRCRLIDYINSSADARRATYAELIHNTSIKASERTIARTLHKEIYHRCIALRKPYLTPAAMDKRYEWGLVD